MRKHLKALSIQQKIYGGFGVMVALGLVISGFSVVKNVSVSDDFSTFDEMAGVALLASEIDAHMAKALYNTSAFMATRADNSLSAAHEFLKETRAGIEQAQSHLKNPERREMVAQMGPLLDQYETGLNKVVELYRERDKLVDEGLDSIGKEVRKNLSKFQQDIADNGLYQEANLVGAAIEQVLLSQIYVNRFLASNEPMQIMLALSTLGKADTAMVNLASGLADPAWKAAVKKNSAMLTKYKEAATRLRDLIAERNEIRERTVNANGEAISKLADALTDSTIADEKVLSRQALNSIEMAIVMILIVGIAALAIGAASGFSIARSIVGPIRSMTRVMGALAAGNHEEEIPARDRKDEIGEMAAAVQVFKDNMIENLRLQEEQRRADEERAATQARLAEQEKVRAEEQAQIAKAAEEKTKRLEQLAGDFDKTVNDILSVFSSASQQLQNAAQSMSGTAEETSRQSNAVAAATEQATTNVQTVATAAEELSSSIAEIARQISESSRTAQSAVDEAAQVNTRVQSLSEAAQKIGDVIGLITDIASQTNLLALNATIEAARAGEAGKGFAVVATEVKSLADQTAKATEEISGQIGDIQEATVEAVAAIDGISSTISRISEITATISAAVEEQGAATHEISSSAQQAAAGTNEVSSNIAGVSSAAATTGTAASQVLGAASEVSEKGKALRTAVDEFLQKVRAA